jgi:hypothetical protein
MFTDVSEVRIASIIRAMIIPYMLAHAPLDLVVTPYWWGSGENILRALPQSIQE